MTKATYQSKYISLKEAAEMFATPDDLLLALKEGALVAEGRHSTDVDLADFEHGYVALNDGEETPTYRHTPIHAQLWETAKADLERNWLNREYGTDHGLYGFTQCTDIRLVRGDVVAMIGEEHVTKPTTQKRENEFHVFVHGIIQEMQQKTNVFPKVKDVWKYLDDNCLQYSIIQEITTEGGGTIYWLSSYGNEQHINRDAFHNLVSKIRRKKIEF